MAHSMEARKRNGPLSPVWQGIKSKHKEMTAAFGFTPDIGKPIGKYDQNLVSYDKLIGDAQKIPGMFNDLTKTIETNNVELVAANNNMHTLYLKGTPYPMLLKDLAEGGRSDDEVISRLERHIAGAQELETKRKALHDRMSTLAMNMTTYVKKFKDDYKAKTTAIDSRRKKLEEDASQQEEEIRQLALKYQQLAIKRNMRKISDDMDDLLAKLR